MSNKLKGKVVWITGATGGLGRELCRSFGRAGAIIAVSDLRKKDVQALVNALQSEQIQCAGFPCDVTHRDQCKKVARKIKHKLGGVDVLIANAGITHRSAFIKTEPEVIERVMDVNFMGAVNVTHAALGQIIKRNGGVIATSSIAGIAPLIGRTGYSASKHALHGFYDSLRTELNDRDVRVMLVCPGFIDTPLDQNALGSDGKPLRKSRAVIGSKMSADNVAGRILKAYIGGRRLYFPSLLGRVSYLLSRLWPGLYDFLMARKLKDEFKV